MTSYTLGATGTHRGRTFVLEGRSLVRGGRSAWNEWTLRFDERTVFLSEWAGSLTLYDEASIVPAFEAFVPGTPAFGWTVVERGEARRIASWGSAAAGAGPYRYVDLSSTTGVRATIDYRGAEPRVFLGSKVTTDDLGLTAEPARFFPTAEVSRPREVDLWLEVGAEGTVEATPFRVLGIVSRSTEVRWDEYALYDPRVGLRWLVLADGHWSLATAIEPGCVAVSESGARFEGTTYVRRATADARVDWASGELTWEVAIGDVASVTDFACEDGATLTCEGIPGAVSWTRSVPLPTDAVAQAFGKRTLPRPR